MATVTSVTSNPPAAIQTLIDAHIKGFNTQDNDLFLSVFGDTAIIIDGVAPYRWLNPNAGQLALFVDFVFPAPVAPLSSSDDADQFLKLTKPAVAH